MIDLTVDLRIDLIIGYNIDLLNNDTASMPGWVIMGVD